MVIGALERLQNRMIQGATKQLGTVHPKSWVHIHYIDWLLGARLRLELRQYKHGPNQEYTAFNKQHLCICTVHYNH